MDALLRSGKHYGERSVMAKRSAKQLHDHTALASLRGDPMFEALFKPRRQPSAASRCQGGEAAPTPKVTRGSLHQNHGQDHPDLAHDLTCVGDANLDATRWILCLGRVVDDLRGSADQ